MFCDISYSCHQWEVGFRQELLKSTLYWLPLYIPQNRNRWHRLRHVHTYYLSRSLSSFNAETFNTLTLNANIISIPIYFKLFSENWNYSDEYSHLCWFSIIFPWTYSPVFIKWNLLPVGQKCRSYHCLRLHYAHKATLCYKLHLRVVKEPEKIVHDKLTCSFLKCFTFLGRLFIITMWVLQEKVIKEKTKCKRNHFKLARLKRILNKK